MQELCLSFLLPGSRTEHFSMSRINKDINTQCGVADRLIDVDREDLGSNPCSALEAPCGIELVKPLVKYISYLKSPIKVTITQFLLYST